MICRVIVVVVLDSFVCLISLINLVSFFQWHEKKTKNSNNKWIKISLLSEENCISWPTLPLFAHTTRGYIIKLTLTIIVAGWSICTYKILSQFLFEMLHSHPLLHFMVHSLSFVRQWQFSFLNLVDIEHDFFLHIRLLSFSSNCELVFVRSWPILMPAIVIEKKKKKSKTLKTKVFVCFFFGREDRSSVLCLPVVCVCCNILELLDTWRRLVADLEGMAWRVRYTHSDPKWHDRRINADLIGSFKGKCVCFVDLTN